MEKLYLTLYKSLFTTLLITFLLIPSKTFSQQELLKDEVSSYKIKETTATSSAKNYPDNLQTLIDYFDKKGVNLVKYLEDPRFKFYEGISNRFINAAEYKSGNFENYKVVLGYESKKNLIADFMGENASALAEAEEKYGIPKYVISAIIGVESSYGKVTGKYNPFNAYVSMYSENYRADFAKAQLEELLLWTDRNKVDVFELKSSYAGAMAYAQFIPYSLNRWFVGNNLADMNNNIYSVANYLAHFKEITGSVEKAVYRYNPSQMYTDAVMALANEAKNMATSAK
ncbi:MAG: lytic murein transglycosylase [Balneolaceae bacterium]